MTRADLRAILRSRLSDWPLGTTVSSEVGLDDLIFMVVSTAPFSPNSFALIGTEFVLVHSVDSENNSISVSRSESQAYPSGTIIISQFVWSDQEINDSLQKAFDASEPWFPEVTFSADAALSLDTYIYMLPSEFQGIPSKIDKVYLKPSGVERYVPTSKWRVAKTQIEFTHKASDLFKFDYYRLVGRKSLSCPLNDEDTFTLEKMADEAIIQFSLYLLLQTLLFNRTKYQQYSALLTDRAATIDEIQRVAYFAYNQHIQICNRFGRTHYASG